MSDSSGFGIVPRHLRGKLTAMEIAMYVALSWRADDKGISWASQKTMAEDAGMSRASVQRTLDGLESKGLVKRVPWTNDRGRASNVYMLKIWTADMPTESSIDRKDGHPSTPKPKRSGRKVADRVPTESTSLGSDVPKTEGQAGKPRKQAKNQGGVPHTDAYPRLTERQQKKNQENETHNPPPTPPQSEGDPTLNEAGLTLDEQILFIRDIKDAGIRSTAAYVQHLKKTGSLPDKISSWRLEQEAARLTPTQIRKRRGVPERDPAKEWMYNQ